MRLPIIFPNDFFWGAATSAHQTEGLNTQSDWWEWEREYSQRAARKARGRTWPEHLANRSPSPLTERNYQSGNACDHYNRFREDFALAQELGHNAHRMGIEWARIEPAQDRFDLKEVEHYRHVLKELRARAIVPLVTLNHFTVPRWLAEKGGWLAPDAVRLFARYASFLLQQLGDLADRWITVNEPAAVISNGYLTGRWPPQKRNPFAWLSALRTLARAHNAAYHALHERAQARNQTIEVGIAYNVQAWIPARNSPLDRMLARIARYVSYEWFLDKIKKQMDFIGINYYFSGTTHMRLGNPFRNGCGSREKGDNGWDMCPDGLRRVLHDVWKRYQKPLYVSENGIADGRDILRPRFVVDHVAALHEARESGVDVRGYFYWSLLDNFEWSDGFTQRFGLVEVDYATQKRTPRPSAFLYRDIIKQNGITEEILREYGLATA